MDSKKQWDPRTGLDGLREAGWDLTEHGIQPTFRPRHWSRRRLVAGIAVVWLGLIAILFARRPFEQWAWERQAADFWPQTEQGVEQLLAQPDAASILAGADSLLHIGMDRSGRDAKRPSAEITSQIARLVAPTSGYRKLPWSTADSARYRGLVDKVYEQLVRGITEGPPTWPLGDVRQLWQTTLEGRTQMGEWWTPGLATTARLRAEFAISADVGDTSATAPWDALLRQGLQAWALTAWRDGSYETWLSDTTRPPRTTAEWRGERVRAMGAYEVVSAGKASSPDSMIAATWSRRADDVRARMELPSPPTTRVGARRDSAPKPPGVVRPGW